MYTKYYNHRTFINMLFMEKKVSDRIDSIPWCKNVNQQGYSMYDVLVDWVLDLYHFRRFYWIIKNTNGIIEIDRLDPKNITDETYHGPVEDIKPLKMQLKDGSMRVIPPFTHKFIQHGEIDIIIPDLPNIIIYGIVKTDSLSEILNEVISSLNRFLDANF